MYAMTIPLGTGLTMKIEINSSSGKARAALVDDHYGDLIYADELLGFADSLLGTYFLIPEPLAAGDQKLRCYTPMAGWTPDGWVSTFAPRVRECWRRLEQEMMLPGEYA